MSTIKTQNKLIYGPYDQHITCDLLTPPGENKTKQSFAEECDINCIMAKYERTGIIESGNSKQPQYGEASAFDFQQAQNLVIQAELSFNALPAGVRSKFDNNAHIMLGWLDNPENRSEAITMGLLPAPTVEKPSPYITSNDVPPMPHQTAPKGAGAPIPPL